MARLAAVAALALVFLVGAASAATCTDAITGYTGTYGKRIAGKTDRFNNQTAQWKAAGNITKLHAYYNTSAKCVQGLKTRYGPASSNAVLLGKEKGLATRDLTLLAGEHFTQVQVKADRCVEYLRLSTNLGRTLAIGNSASVRELRTANPNKTGGYVAAIRGYEQYTKNTNGAVVRDPMETLQFVWANCRAATTASAVPLPVPSPSPVVAAVNTPAAPKLLTEPALPICPPALEGCATTADKSSPAYCSIVSPFIKRACVGGCCASGGKCASSSCALAGIGKEVANTICYGLNPASVIGASPNCQGLGCWLTVPSCTSDLLGGSCLGTVVDLSGNATMANPAGVALVGMPCLDVTPSDKAMDIDGTLSQYGKFVAKLWTVCDCNTTIPTAAAAAPPGLSLPSLSKLNFTSIGELVSAIKGIDANHPLQSVASLAGTKIASLAVPQLPAANITSALAFLGSLVGKPAGAAAAAAAPSTPLNAVVNLVKGASLLSSALNSTSPLPKLLGALSTKTAANSTNPLAGLANLVSALAPGDADTTDRADVLASLFSALTGSTGVSPASTLLSAVSSLLGRKNSPFDVSGLLTMFQLTPSNSTAVMRMITDAITETKAAASGDVDLLGIFGRLQSWLGAGAGSGATGTASNGTTAAATPAAATAANSLSLSSIVSGVSALAGLGGTPAGAVAASNPLSFLNGLMGLGGGSAAGPAASATRLQQILNLATTAAPLLSSLNGGAAPAAGTAANPLTTVLALLPDDFAGPDINALSKLTTQAGPLLQALGGGAASGGSPVAGGNLVGTAASVLGALSGGSTSGLNLSNLSDMMSVASKAAPVLKALQGAAAGSSSGGFLGSVMSFLDSVSA